MSPDQWAMVVFGVAGFLVGGVGAFFLLEDYYYREIKRSLKRTDEIEAEMFAFHREVEEALDTKLAVDLPEWVRDYLDAGFTVERRHGSWRFSKKARELVL